MIVALEILVVAIISFIKEVIFRLRLRQIGKCTETKGSSAEFCIINCVIFTFATYSHRHMWAEIHLEKKRVNQTTLNYIMMLP